MWMSVIGAALADAPSNSTDRTLAWVALVVAVIALAATFFRR